MKAAKPKAGTSRAKDASFADPKPSSKPSSRPSSKPTSDTHKRWKFFFYWVSVVGVWGFIVGGVGLAYIAWDLPNVNDAIQASRKPVIRILTRDGFELARRGDRYGDSIRLEDVPVMLPHAILATEDRRFYNHFGVDLIGIARAMWVNIKAGGIRQGGSTLTQQAAKNLFLKTERTFRRKFQEVLLALWLEAKFSKDQILTIYMNRVYFGQSVYGVDAAARHYFGISSRNLTNYQAAMLAGMLKGPNKYNPNLNLKLAKKRTEVVLRNMVAAGYFSKADSDAVERPKVWHKPKNKKLKPMARHYVDWILDQVGDYVTLDQDVNVFVSLDARLQKQANKVVARMMKSNGAAMTRKASEVALVTLAPDGAVLAMVGGRNYAHSRFNRAVQAKRQPGSAFKPIAFLAGFEAGLTPDSKMIDEPITIDEWSPQNFNKSYSGKMSLSDAMTRSINTIAVKVSEQAGRQNVKAMAKKLGITAALTDKPSLALGVSEISLLEMTAAYGAFATGGLGVWPYGILEIQDSAGHPLYVRSGGGPGRVIPAAFAGAMNSMLSRVINDPKGTGKAAKLGRPAAGKTGTSQDYRDAWFIGYTADLITGVWMGNDNGAPMKGITGGNYPAKLWKNFMGQAATYGKAKPLPNEQLPAKAKDGGSPNEALNPAKDFLKGLMDRLLGP